ncbi:MAG TPA: HAD hydrolase-like protein [Oligoflexus sp.]|uniref:HAD family hydrolase n=1 Tax=Oligoflexus sp. TaxID=1971216 RepID=UPI002D808D35|nr:HAD hydrolase-like protein [Oligoflexus sp.]HET9237292.1 HAD hydrolase-like protein [Oligoflexus sp.]
MSYRVLLFDIDGTLVRAGGAGKAALARALNELHAVENPYVDINFGGRTDQSITKELFELHGISWSPRVGQEFLDLYAHYFHEALAQRAPILLPGVRELLQRLQDDQRHLMGLLTGNIERCAQIKLDAFQLWPYFNFGGFGDHHEDRAEIAAEAFRRATLLHGAELRPHEVLIIGDTPADVRCARAIGADVLIVGTGPVAREAIDEAAPDFFHEDLSRLDDILGLLRTGRL